MSRSPIFAKAWLQYALALVLVVVAVWIEWLLVPGLRRAVLVPLYVAVVVASAVGGIGPGLVVTVLGTLSANLFFFGPRWSLRVDDPADLAQMIAFLIAGTFVSVFSGYARREQGLAREEAARARNAEAHMREQHAALEEALLVRDRFLAMLSHELRTPLSPALMTLSSMEHAADTPEHLRSDLAVARHGIELETRLIDDLLDVTAIQKGKLSLASDVIDPAEALSRAIEICRSAARDKDLELSLHLDAGPGVVRGELVRLQQVFWNLLRNAIKFTPSRGRIEITTRLEAASSAPRPAVFVAQVSDTGRGIVPELLPRLFEAFEQGSKVVTREFGGLGLGLAISRFLVELHGGSIHATSAGRDQGATFTVKLPLLDGDHPIAPAPSHPAPRACAPLSVMVVDDDRTSLLVTCRLLEKLGHRVQSAGSVQQALATLRQGSFDLLVSDIGLPDGTGYELLTAYRADGHTLKSIALSGYGRNDDLEQSKAAGFSEHLVKPVTIAKLTEAIARIV